MNEYAAKNIKYIAKDTQIFNFSFQSWFIFLKILFERLFIKLKNALVSIFMHWT